MVSGCDQTFTKKRDCECEWGGGCEGCDGCEGVATDARVVNGKCL